MINQLEQQEFFYLKIRQKLKPIALDIIVKSKFSYLDAIKKYPNDALVLKSLTALKHTVGFIYTKIDSKSIN